MRRRETLLLLLLMAPAAAAFAAFWLLPMARLAAVAGSGPLGIAAYAAILTNPRYFASLVATILLSAGATDATLPLANVGGRLLPRDFFSGPSPLLALPILPF